MFICWKTEEVHVQRTAGKPWYKPRSRVVTADFSAGVQHQRWAVVVYASRHGHKFLSRDTVIWRPVAGDRQHCTPATHTKFFMTYPFVCFFHVDKTVFLVYSRDLSKICWRVTMRTIVVCHWGNLLSSSVGSITSRHVFQDILHTLSREGM